MYHVYLWICLLGLVACGFAWDLGLKINARERAFQRPPDETESRDEESVGGAGLFISGVATVDTCNISSSSSLRLYAI